MNVVMLSVVMLNVVAPLRGVSLGPASALLTNVRVLWKRTCSISFCHSGSHKSNSNGIYTITKIALIAPEPTPVTHLLGAPL